MRTSKEKSSAAKAAKQAALAVAFGLTVTAVLLSVAALLMTVRDLPNGAFSPVVAAALGIGTFFAGWWMSSRFRKNGLLSGAAVGFLIFAVIFLVGLTVNGSVNAGFAAFKLAVSVLCGAIGGVLGVGKR